MYRVKIKNPIWGVPITYLEHHCPEQYKVIGKMTTTKVDDINFGYPYINSRKIYARILIQEKI